MHSDKILAKKEQKLWMPSLWGCATFKLIEKSECYTLVKKGGDVWRTIVGTKPFSEGIHYWEIEVVSPILRNCVYFGIVNHADIQACGDISALFQVFI